MTRYWMILYNNSVFWVSVRVIYFIMDFGFNIELNWRLGWCYYDNYHYIVVEGPEFYSRIIKY